MIRTTEQLLTLVDDAIEKMREQEDLGEVSIWELRRMVIECMAQENMVEMVMFDFKDREEEYKEAVEILLELANRYRIDLFNKKEELDAEKYVLGLGIHLDAGLMVIVPTEWAINEGMFEAR